MTPRRCVSRIILALAGWFLSVVGLVAAIGVAPGHNVRVGAQLVLLAPVAVGAWYCGVAVVAEARLGTDARAYTPPTGGLLLAVALLALGGLWAVVDAGTAGFDVCLACSVSTVVTVFLHLLRTGRDRTGRGVLTRA